MSKYNCPKCKKTSPLEHWLVTTAFLLGVSVEQLKLAERSPKLFFCPHCANMNVFEPKFNDDSKAPDSVDTHAEISDVTHAEISDVTHAEISDVTHAENVKAESIDQLFDESRQPNEDKHI